MTRHEARRQAFLLLFAYSLSQTPVKELIDLAEEAGTLLPEDTAQDLPPQPVDDFAARIAAGVEAHREELDAVIEKYANGWSLQRITKVCLSLLRLSLFEMRYTSDVPLRVSIDEAVEFAKEYGGEEDAAFLNGVLGGAAKECTENA
mgnify:FL=1